MRRFFENRQMGRGAMIVAIVALCVGLGGGAFAAKLKLSKNAVKTKNIKNNAVTERKIADGAISGAKLNAGAVASKVSIISKHPGQTLNVNAGESNAGTVTCPAGYIAIAGQADWVSPTNVLEEMQMISTHRDDTNPAVWHIRMGSNNGDQVWRLFATCIKVD